MTTAGATMTDRPTLIDIIAAALLESLVSDEKNWVSQRKWKLQDTRRHAAHVAEALGRLQAPPRVPMPVRILYRPDSEDPS